MCLSCIKLLPNSTHLFNVLSPKVRSSGNGFATSKSDPAKPKNPEPQNQQFILQPLLRHCQQLLLNLLIVLCEHLDHLTVSSILMNNKTEGFDFGLVLSALPVLEHNFTEKPLDIPREKGEDDNCEEAGREDREESEERSHEGYSEEGWWECLSLVLSKFCQRR